MMNQEAITRKESMRYLFPLNPYNQQRQFQKPAWVYPVHLAMYATYLRDQGHQVFWDECRYDYFDHGDVGKIISDDSQIDMSFDKLPIPDRVLTDAKNPRWQAYGNYKFHPATHMMVSNLCWWGKCTFCVDRLKLEGGEARAVRPVEHVMEEIDDLIAYEYREVFDDSGTFPVGKWLREFCEEMILSGRSREIVLGCNMRLFKQDYSLMKRAGFRFILVGIESANQRTLDWIGKGTKADDIIPILRSMTDAGLEAHATFMFGYPWESREDAMRTVDLVYLLLKKGYVKSVQASVFMPPRTRPDPQDPAQQYVRQVYSVYRRPWYLWKKITDIRCRDDVSYLLKRLSLLWKAD